jgi:enterochelin esterase-like enzyme
MKRILISFLPAILLYQMLPAQQEIKRSNEIVFVLESPSLSNDTSVFICGNLPQLANWNPSAIKMKNTGNHTWSLTIKTDASYPIEYKYTLGSWQREGAKANGTPLPNFIVKVTSDTIINDKVLLWLNGKREIKGKITGTVYYYKKLIGNGIRERDIVIWVPPGYEKEKKMKYPVLYMHDGQNIFDPRTSSFGVDWQIDETCDSLIRNRIIDPIIVVGIYNTQGRSSEYSPGKMGTAYMELVVKKIKPFIDSIYRTMPDRKHTYVGGSSSGGTISFMLAWNYPEIFSKALCFSPAFKIGALDLVKEASDFTGKKKKLVFYFDNGGKGLEERLQPGVDEMLKALEEKGFIRNRDLFYVSAPDAEHNEAAWAKRMPEALKLIMTGKK